MLTLSINNTTNHVILNLVQNLNQLTTKTTETINYQEDKVVDLSLVSDSQIQEINKSYRHQDKPTDVISFAFAESEQFPNETLLGEIYISIDTATKQAAERNQSLEEEIAFLFIHGLLHIFGYDHQTDEQEKEMDSLAYQILGRKS